LLFALYIQGHPANVQKWTVITLFTTQSWLVVRATSARQVGSTSQIVEPTLSCKRGI